MNKQICILFIIFLFAIIIGSLALHPNLIIEGRGGSSSSHSANRSTSNSNSTNKKKRK